MKVYLIERLIRKKDSRQKEADAVNYHLFSIYLFHFHIVSRKCWS